MLDGSPRALFAGVFVAAGTAAVAAWTAWLLQYRRDREKTSTKQQSRCDRLLAPVLPYMDGIMRAFAAPFDPVDRPDGYILLAVAENKLAWHDVVKPRVEKALREPNLPDWTACYGSLDGRESLRAAVARFLAARVCRRPIMADEVICVAGVTAAVSGLFCALCEPGDRVLVPRPFYAAFVNDLRAFAECEVVPFDLDDILSVPDDAARPVGFFDEENGTKPLPKALLLTNPHNPLGTMLSRRELETIAGWCDARGVHLVSDEIYALSVFRSSTRQSGGLHDDTGFVSVAELGLESGTRHVLWGLSKDFGVSGLRVGCLVSKNKRVLAAARSAALFSSIPGVVQHLVTSLLSDDAFCDAYLAQNAKRLERSCALVERALDALHLNYVRPVAGIFLWFDLSPLLDSDSDASRTSTFATDMDIYHALLADDFRLVLTPGSSQYAAEPGWFRICYAFVPVPVLEIALDRLATFVRRHRRTSPS